MQTRYTQEVAKFDKKDGILAICVFLAFLPLIGFFPLVLSMMPLPDIAHARIVSLAYMVLLAFGVLIVVRARKQKLSGIGFHKENLVKGIVLGLLFCLIPIIFGAIIPGILHGFFEVSFASLTLTLITTFIFAASEDVISVGFIQTRLYGFIKSHFLAIFVGSLLFALMHIIPWIFMGRLDITQPVDILFQVIRWSAMHFVFVAVFKKYHSLVPVFILHTVNNFTNAFSYSSTTFANISVTILVLAACFLYWQTHKADKKALTR